MVTYVSGIPNIVLAVPEPSDSPMSVVLHVDTDPITGVDVFSLYHDDGYGNGSCILALPVAELRYAFKRLSEKM